jgi:hypothetical protein
MIRGILFLLLCFTPAMGQTIRENTQRTLMAMTNISATQLVDGKPYRVAMFGNRQVFARAIPTPKIGIRPGAEWYSLLQASQLWKLTPAGDHFTYSDHTRWFEISRIAFGADEKWEGLVPCEGEVYVVDNNIVRITQRFNPGRHTNSVSIDMFYEWIQLKQKRLLPSRMTMTAEFKNRRTYKVQVEWVNYQEFGTELIVKEPSETDTLRPVGIGSRFVAEEENLVERDDFGLPTPTGTTDDLKVENDGPSLLQPDARPVKTQPVRPSPWRRFFPKVIRGSNP